MHAATRHYAPVAPPLQGGGWRRGEALEGAAQHVGAHTHGVKVLERVHGAVLDVQKLPGAAQILIGTPQGWGRVAAHGRRVVAAQRGGAAHHNGSAVKGAVEPWHRADADVAGHWPVGSVHVTHCGVYLCGGAVV